MGRSQRHILDTRKLGIDISAHEGKTLDRDLDERFDEVITVCDNANEACPVY